MGYIAYHGKVLFICLFFAALGIYLMRDAFKKTSSRNEKNEANEKESLSETTLHNSCEDDKYQNDPSLRITTVTMVEVAEIAREAEEQKGYFKTIDWDEEDEGTYKYLNRDGELVDEIPVGASFVVPQRRRHATELFEERDSSFGFSKKPYYSEDMKVVFYELNCFKCRKNSHVFWLIEDGEVMHISKAFNYIFSEEIMNPVRDIMFMRNDINMGRIKERYSKKMGRSYVSFGCFHCDALMGMNPVYWKAQECFGQKGFYKEIKIKPD